MVFKIKRIFKISFFSCVLLTIQLVVFFFFFYVDLIYCSLAKLTHSPSSGRFLRIFPLL